MNTLQIGTIVGVMIALPVAIGTSLGWVPFTHTVSAPVQSTVPIAVPERLVAAPGRVEPASEEIHVGVPVTGVLSALLVNEGDHVGKGDVIARIENADYAATLVKAQAELKLREAELQRVSNGARMSERREALAAVHETEAVEKNADAEVARQRELVKNSVISHVTLDDAEMRLEVARQKHREATERYNLVNDPARDEDIAIAEARVEAARAAVNEAQAALDKTVVRSPIDGTILRIYRHSGELVSIFFNQPIVSLGDLSELYVRAEIDEADIAKLEPDMRAYVTAEAYGDRHFPGRVVRISPLLGKKSFLTEEAKERTDTKVLEVLIALKMPTPLRPGLRVTAFVLPPGSPGQNSEASAR